MRSRWPDIDQVRFVRVYGLRRSRGLYKLAKKEQGQHPAILTKQAWSVKDKLFGVQGNFSHRTWQVVLSGQDSSILPAWAANYTTRFGSSCPLMELII